jgi:hypothetical protein
MVDWHLNRVLLIGLFKYEINFSANLSPAYMVTGLNNLV